MAPSPHGPEIIDLTEPTDVIELDSDGEVVQADSPPNDATQTNGAAQNKKKRKKKKRKTARVSAGTAGNADGEVDGSSAETSLPVSRNSPSTSAVAMQVETGDTEPGPSSSAQEVPKKKSLEERLAEPSRSRKGDDAKEKEKRRESEAEGRRKDRRHRNGDSERDRERDRDGDRESRREKDRNRDRQRSRSPRRDRDRDHDHHHRDDRSRRRSRSKDRDREKRRRDKAAKPVEELFFEDVNPTDIPAALKLVDTTSAALNSLPHPDHEHSQDQDEEANGGLLLPDHVFVGEDPGFVKLPTPSGSDEGDDYIEYLEYDDTYKGMVRYWELEKLEAEEAKDSKPTKFLCKKCGEEGTHRTFECRVVICLTCGARDEHLTRSCPISKVCFTCGMKGHINKTCPNRGKYGAYHSSHDCDRCGARSHQTNECPTLWRIYTYVEDDVRQDTLRAREEKSTLPLGEGGEGYIATDEWCYNCGGSGHLGDDCNVAELPFDHPKDNSAFSLYNVLSGPFASDAPPLTKRTRRDWEAAHTFSDGFGFDAPMEVGKRARRKERERLARAAQERDDAQDDAADWFGEFASNRARRGDERAKGNREVRAPERNENGDRKGGGGGKIKFDFSGASFGGDRGGSSKRPRYDRDDLPGPSRETDTIQIRGAARKESYSSRDRGGDRHGGRYDRDRERDRDRDRDYDHERRDRDSRHRGPRYRGGYR